jgi:xylitol oxidase
LRQYNGRKKTRTMMQISAAKAALFLVAFGCSYCLLASSLVGAAAPPAAATPFAIDSTRLAKATGYTLYGARGRPPPPPVLHLSNWGGNFRFSTTDIRFPRSLDEVVDAVKEGAPKSTPGGVGPPVKHLRALGSRHSFSKIADTAEMLVSLSAMNRILAVNPGSATEAPTITVEGGAIYTDVTPFVEFIGAAFHNQLTLSEVSVAGSINTGAHGTGITNGILATQVRSVELVLANGTVTTLRKGVDAAFPAAVVGLGAFGVVTKVELEMQASYQMTQHVFLNLPFTTLTDQFDTIMSSAYTVQAWTDWSDPTNFNQVWVGDRDDDAADFSTAPAFYGATRAPAQVTPVAALPPTYVVPQGVAGPWNERLVCYRLGLSGFNGDEIQSEYILPITNAKAALEAIAALATQIAPLCYVSVVRTIAADDFWLSPAYGRDSVAIHFTWKPQLDAVVALLPTIESALAGLDAVPHWGKFFTMAPSVFLQRYDKLAEWKATAAAYDPSGRFRNAFLNDNVFNAVVAG